VGLIKTGLKAAVAVKTAHVGYDRIERRQRAEWASQAAPAGMGGQVGVGPARTVGAPQALSGQYVPAPQPAMPDTSNMLSDLKQLGELRSSGVLTEAEFEAQKARILAGR
jgi:Short C-terminal domain